MSPARDEERVGKPASTATWICGGCRVVVTWMSGHERKGPPANWAVDEQGPVCLSCRRQRAADIAVGASDSKLSAQDRARLRAAALVEFEVRRDPSRSNSQIAQSVHTSVVAIQKARERLGASAPPAS